jgi:hypothetical protein
VYCICQMLHKVYYSRISKVTELRRFFEKLLGIQLSFCWMSIFWGFMFLIKPRSLIILAKLLINIIKTTNLNVSFLYIKNGWNFLLLYNIDVAIPFMWRPDNRHILTPEFYRMNPKYCTFNSWSSHFLYTCVYRSLCTMNLHWDVHVSQTMHTKGYKCWSYMINNLTMVYKPMYFFYNSTINSQVYFSWLRLLVFSRCTRYNIMG